MTLRVLSLGAGVQSTCVALMAATGALEPIEHAIFADTGDEPLAVYEHLAWLEVELAWARALAFDEAIRATPAVTDFDGQPLHTEEAPLPDKERLAGLVRELKAMLDTKKLEFDKGKKREAS